MVSPDPPTTQSRVDIRDAQRLEYFTNYHTALNYYRRITRDSMSRDIGPKGSDYEEFKSYVLTLYVDLKPVIDMDKNFHADFVKLDVLVNEKRFKLSYEEARHYFFLLREVLAKMGIT